MNTQPGQPSIPSVPTTPAAASRVQSAVAKANGGQVPTGSQAARMQAAAARNFPSGRGGRR